MKPVKAALRDILSGLSLLSRLPLPAHDHSGAASGWSWPLAGLIIALPAALVILAGGYGAIAPGPLAAAALALMSLLSGGLHEDGLSDTADGLLGGRDPARRLEIMKDSRIGSFGALALLLVTLISWSALSTLIAKGEALPALLAAAALSRLPMVVIMATLPAARSGGISAATGRPPALTVIGALILGLGAGFALLGLALILPVLVAALACLWLALFARARIGGQTGDILGASQQIAFALILMLLS